MATYYENKDLKNRAGVYQIRNLVNGKIYVGSSVNLKQRKANHFSKLKKQTHDNAHLQAAYNKYGKENFIFEVIEFTSEQDAPIREAHYILTLGVLNNNIGYNLKDGTNVNIADAISVICLETQEIYSSIAEAVRKTGITGISECCNEKQYTAGKYHWMKLEKYNKLTEEEIKNWLKLGNKDACTTKTPVICLETKKVYSSLGEASRAIGGTHEAISQACRGILRSSGKLHWMFLSDFQEATEEEIQARLKLKAGWEQPVVCLETKKTFESMANAARSLNIGVHSIYSSCSKKTPAGGGYHWEYLSNYLKMSEKDISNRINRRPKDRKRIYCIELDKEFESINAASRYMNISPHEIIKSAKGLYKKPRKYTWKYI